MTDAPQPARRRGRVFVEILGVVFAVLIALAVDEMWQSRENEELGRDADARVLAEIEANREEVRSSSEANTALLEAVQRSLGQSPDSAGLDVDYSLSLLSRAAWDAAGLTGAIRFMDFDRVSSFSRLYDLQALYQERQRGMVDVVAGVVTLSSEDFGEASLEEVNRIVARRIFGPLAIAASLETNLLAMYDSVLVELGPEER